MIILEVTVNLALFLV